MRAASTACALVVGTLLAVTRPTIAGLVLALGLTDADWSAFYRLPGRERLDYETLTRCYLRETLAQIPAPVPYVVVMDGTQLPRSSRTMPGTAWLQGPAHAARQARHPSGATV